MFAVLGHIRKRVLRKFEIHSRTLKSHFHNIYIIISKTWHTKRTHTNSNRYILFSQSYSLVDISIESMLLLYSAWMVQKLWISHFPVPILSHPHSHNFHSDLVGGSVELSSFRFCRSHSLACLFRAIPKSHRISIHLSSENG